MMLDILLFPFKFVFGLLEGLFGLLGGLFGAIFGLIGGFFGLVGGILGLCIKLSVIGLIIGLVVTFFKRRGTCAAEPAKEEEFVSYYDKNAVK